MVSIALESIAICELWQEKEKWDYLPLPYLFHTLANGLVLPNANHPNYFDFINPQIDHSIKRAIKAFIAFVKSLKLVDSLVVYDLKDYDAEFSFIEPPTLSIHHLPQVLKTIYNAPDKLKQYAYIGFKREQLEQMLGFSLLSNEQQAMISELENQLLQQAPKEPTTPDTLEQREKSLLQIIAVMAQELSNRDARLRRGNNLNKSALAKILCSSKMNFLLKQPKGEEAFRQVLKKMDISLQPMQ